jgi:hypothetical protein
MNYNSFITYLKRASIINEFENSFCMDIVFYSYNYCVVSYCMGVIYFIFLSFRLLSNDLLFEICCVGVMYSGE